MPSFIDKLKSAFAPSSTDSSDRASMQAATAASLKPTTPEHEAPVEKIGFSKTGMLHRAYFPREGNQNVLADCNLETMLNEVRDATHEDSNLTRCGRCYPNAARRKEAAPRRKTLARRSPELIYLVVPDREALAVTVKAWFANDYGRIDKDRGVIAVATITDLESDQIPTRDNWVSSKDTDMIYSLHEEVRVGIFELDDAIREATKR